MVLIEGEEIAASGPDLRIPAGAERIDLGDATLCPGFIDAHTHLTVGVKSYNEFFIDRFRHHVAEKAYQAAVHARVTLEGGFTTVRDVGCLYPDSFIDVSLRNAIAKGLLPGPRMLVAINLIGATGGHSDRNAGLHFHATGRESDYTDGIADSPADLRKAVRFNVKYGADVIKFCASGGVMSLADEVDTPQLTLDEMTAVVDEAHRLRKRVAVHCHGDSAARDAIEAGVDSIEHGTFLRDETLEAMKASGVYLVPTLLVQHQLGRGLDRLPPELAVKARQAVEAAPGMVKRALEIGVTDRAWHRFRRLPPWNKRSRDGPAGEGRHEPDWRAQECHLGECGTARSRPAKSEHWKQANAPMSSRCRAIPSKISGSPKK